VPRRRPDFPAEAARLAHLLSQDRHIRLVFLSLGGWDTHVKQGKAKGQLANRLQPLGEGLLALARGLGNAWDDTVIVVLSEFGRRVRENGNGGTDHGHGNVIWVLGGGVRGGRVYGDWPGSRRRNSIRAATSRSQPTTVQSSPPSSNATSTSTTASSRRSSRPAAGAVQFERDAGRLVRLRKG